MATKRVMLAITLMAMALLAVLTVQAAPAAPQGTGFTYQGRLEEDGTPVSDECDLQFGLWDAQMGGSQAGITQTLPGVSVHDGYFSVLLNGGGEFGPDAFQGDERFLAIRVRCPAAAGDYASLGRQALTTTPYAHYALAASWSGLANVPPGFADGLDQDTTYSAGSGLDLSGTQFRVLTSTIQQRVAGTCPPGSSIRTVYQDGSVDCEEDSLSSGGGGGDITAVYAGPGLAGGGLSEAVTLTVAFAGSGSQDFAARSDHGHDARYYTQAALNISGGGGQVHWDNLVNVPADLADGDSDTLTGLDCAAGHIPRWTGAAWICDADEDSLGSLSCASGQVPEWNGSAWACDADDDSLDTLSCAADQVPRWSGSAWICSEDAGDGDTLAGLNCGDGQLATWHSASGQWVCGDDADTDTTYSAGYGLGLDGTQFQVLTGTIQQRVDTSCPVGWSIREIDPQGTVTCELDSNTTYSPGFGLQLLGAQFQVLTATVQQRVGASCPAGSSIREIYANGTVACEEDDLSTGGGGDGDVTAVLAGDGLEGGGLSGDVTLSASFGGTGIATTLARSDHNHNGTYSADGHDHDARYYTQSELNTGGGGGWVHWDNLTSVPPDLEDGDSDTLADLGLSCASGQLPRWDAGAWICDDDQDSLGALICASGQLARWNGLAWDCDDDRDSLNTLVCAGGQLLKWNGAAWDCGDDNDTPYTAGFGLDLTGSEFQVVTSDIQERVAGVCPEGQSIRAIDESGLVTCELDDDTTYTAGTQLTLTGTSFDLLHGTGSGLDADLLDGQEASFYQAWQNLTGVPSGLNDGDDDTTYTAGTGLTLTAGTFNLQGSYRLPQSCTGGQIAEWDGDSWECGTDDQGTTGSYWSLTGNAGTTPGTHFLGTTDAATVTLAVQGATALRLGPTTGTPNLVGGSQHNKISPGLEGIVIAGGGSALAPNAVRASWGTVGGGYANVITDVLGTIGGGSNNSVTAFNGTVGGGDSCAAKAMAATVGGGQYNIASGQGGTVCGGSSNTASGSRATVGGGQSNLAAQTATTVGGGQSNRAGALNATVGGGYQNVISGTAATIAGGRENIATGEGAALSGGRLNEGRGSYGALGGGFGNTITSTYATIAGGRQGTVGGDYGAIGGGYGNWITSTYSTIGGGYQNWTKAEGATVSGGRSNHAEGIYATLGGGSSNVVTGDHGAIGGGSGSEVTGNYATVGGGEKNKANGIASTVAGGTEITVTSNFGFVGGGVQNRAISTGYGTIGGGMRNSVVGDYGTIGGGSWNQANSNSTTVGGGAYNVASHTFATVAGGNGNWAGGEKSMVGGGQDNIASGTGSTISGGEKNRASGIQSTVAGGTEITVTSNFGFVGGGVQNKAISTGYGTIGGGMRNSVVGDYGTIGGGSWNQANSNSTTVGGGAYNVASHTFATVAGGNGNWAGGQKSTVGGGQDNTASGTGSTISGGEGITVTGDYATVPGGYKNLAEGDYSLAGGKGASAQHNGSFVWADTYTTTQLSSDRANQFKVRAWGGSRFEDGNNLWVELNWSPIINTSTGAQLTNGGVWTNASDRNAKENFEAIDAQQVLAQVAALPITTWNYKAEDRSIRHLGPTAQDFHAAFGLGDSEVAIGTLDADGVAMAAIQALYEQNQALATENAALRSEAEAQQSQLDEMEVRLSALEAGKAPADQLTGRLLPWAGGLLVAVAGVWTVGRGQLGDLVRGGRR